MGRNKKRSRYVAAEMGRDREGSIVEKQRRQRLRGEDGEGDDEEGEIKEKGLAAVWWNQQENVLESGQVTPRGSRGKCREN